MRKKSHILLAKYVADQIEDDQSLQTHRKALCMGSILPDIKPTFITKRHEFFGTINDVTIRMQNLIEHGPGEGREGAYWRRFGEVLHYLADYFTFPHNRHYTGNLYQHNKYEKHLKNRLKEYIESGAVRDFHFEPIRFDNLGELIDFVRVSHESYLKEERCISEDLSYILMIVLQAAYGMIQLCGDYLKDNNVSLISAVY